MRIKAEIEISTREDVLNPEAKAILHALQSLKFPVKSLSVSKKFYAEIESKSEDDALKRLESACKELLANPIIENYTISINGRVATKSKKKDSTKRTKKVATKSNGKKRGRDYKYDEFLDSISDKLYALKYNENMSFNALSKALEKAFGIKISVKALYEYFIRKLSWQTTK